MKNKDLIINGVLYAKYNFEGHILFINVQKDIFKNKNEDNILSLNQIEGLLGNVISLVENKPIKAMGYLNLKAEND